MHDKFMESLFDETLFSDISSQTTVI